MDETVFCEDDEWRDTVAFLCDSGHLLPSGSHELSYSSVRGGVKVYGGFNTDLQSEAVIAMTA